MSKTELKESASNFVRSCDFRSESLPALNKAISHLEDYLSSPFSDNDLTLSFFEEFCPAVTKSLSAVSYISDHKVRSR